LELTYDEPLSKFAFKFNLRRCISAVVYIYGYPLLMFFNTVGSYLVGPGAWSVRRTDFNF